MGLTSLPQPGDSFQTVADAAKARQIATFRQAQAKERALGAKGGRLTLESLKEQIAEGGVKELPIIVKADVQGSAEVLADTLTKLSDEKVKIRIIRSGVGAINESDVLLASASNAIIIGFNVRPDRNAADMAEREQVDVRLHSVIYNVTDEIKKGMAGLLDPTFKEVRLGSAEVREVFKVPKIGAIAGCMVTDGRITRAGERRRACCATTSWSTKARSVAAPLQGRRQRGQDRLRVRHRPRELQRHQGRRRHRSVLDGEGRESLRNDARDSGQIASATRSAQELSELLSRGAVHDPGIGFITLTRVKVSPDLQVARVYYTTLGDEEARRQTAKALAARHRLPPPPGRRAPAAAAGAGARVPVRRIGGAPGPHRADPPRPARRRRAAPGGADRTSTRHRPDPTRLRAGAGVNPTSD